MTDFNTSTDYYIADLSWGAVVVRNDEGESEEEKKCD